MLDIGRHIDSVHSDDTGETILGVVNAVRRNKIITSNGGDTFLNLSIANSFKRLDSIFYPYWRVIGMGMYWRVASTANEDPIIDFGEGACFGKMTLAITGGEKMCAGDFLKYDPIGILAPEKITETSATLVVTWLEGVKFNVWQKTAMDLHVSEAAVAAMTTGGVRCFMLIEVDTGGKW